MLKILGMSIVGKLLFVPGVAVSSLASGAGKSRISAADPDSGRSSGPRIDRH